MGDYYPRTPPRPVKDGIKARSKRGDIGETWWSKRWITVLKSFNMGARLDRGRGYARKGQVISIKVNPGKVLAKVQGTQKKPYSVRIELEPFSDEAWEIITDALASQAYFAANLLSGVMPQTIEQPFEEVGMSLFPESTKELNTHCSCPDWANPCKHIAAVYYLLAEQFDEDPFLLFVLRGRTKEQIIEVLREKRTRAFPGGEPAEIEITTENTVPLEQCIETFWEAGESLAHFEAHPSPPDVKNSMIRRLGNSPFTVKGENISSILSVVYEAVTRASLKKAFPEDEEDQP
ncbi:MAG: SWIM zinc finger family protein [Candidatus Methanofastidiosia archaeon]